MFQGALGANIPDHKPYAEKYPLTAVPLKAAQFKPVVLGINWYSNFDSPVQKDGAYWIGLNPKNLGYVRGGHAIPIKPQYSSPGVSLTDKYVWHEFYDQGSEGACVGFSTSRVATWFNRYRFDGFWLYDEARKIDGFQPPDHEGTSVDAGFKVVSQHHRRVYGVYPESIYESPSAKWRFAAYRWASSVDEVRAALASPNHDKHNAVPLFNSWGLNYPQYVWMPYETLARLLSENGEAGVPTDA